MEPVTTTVAAKVGTEAAELLKKSDSFLSAVLGEPAKAFGGLLADRINARRHANLVKITVQAKQKLDEAGVSAKEVPLKIIHPMIEAASLEEDPDLQEAWTNLLANAADPRSKTEVLPCFAIILRGLASADARLLNKLFTSFEVTINQEGLSLESGLFYTVYDLRRLHHEGLTFDEPMIAVQVSADTLTRAGLISKTFMRSGDNIDSTDPLFEPAEHRYQLTSLGLIFIMACRPPQKEQPFPQPLQENFVVGGGM